MDAAQVVSVLQGTYAPDAALRASAEASLRSLMALPGGALILLQASTVASGAPREVRQAAAVSLKNCAKRHWVADLSRRASESVVAAVVPVETRAEVRAAIVPALLVETDSSITGLLAEATSQIVEHDYPEKWPELLPALVSSIQTSEPLRVHNALLALRKLCKRYEYRPQEKRGPLEHIVQTTFPLLLQLLQQLQQYPAPEAATIMRLALKCFWSCCQLHLPQCSRTNAEFFVPWYEVLRNILVRDLPEAEQPASHDDRPAWPWWKLKKWAAQIAFRFISRYGNPKYTEDHDKPVATHFKDHEAIQMLQPIMNLLLLRPAGKYVSDRVLNLSMFYVASALDFKATWLVIKQNLEFLLTQCVLPVLCISAEEMALITEEPVEFVRKANDLTEEYYDVRHAASQFLYDLAKQRPQALPLLLGKVAASLEAYRALPPNSHSVDDMRRKDGALRVLGVIEEQVKQNKTYAGQLEGLLVTHVYPEFASRSPSMRSRACWTVRHFYDIDFVDKNNLSRALELVCTALQDPESLVVRIEAADALKSLLQLDGTEAVLEPHLPKILNEIFTIMGQIGSDVVVGALEEVVNKFEASIEPHAVLLVQKLSEAFIKYAKESADEDDDEAEFAAVQCIDVMSRVLSAVHARPGLYQQSEPYLVPLIVLIFSSEDYLDYLENALEVLDHLTYHGETLSPAVWSTFGPLFMSFNGWAPDYLPNMAISIENFIQKGNAHFLVGNFNGVRYVECVLGMAHKGLSYKVFDRSEKKSAHLLLAMLHSCPPGSIDDVLPVILDLVLQRLGDEKPDKKSGGLPGGFVKFKVALVMVIASAMRYNPMGTLAHLEARGVTADVFSKWFGLLGDHESYLSKKCAVLGLLALLSPDPATLPALVQSHMGLIVCKLVETIEAVVKQEADDAGGGGGLGSDDEDDDSDGEMDSDDEDEDEDGDGDQDRSGYSLAHTSATLGAEKSGGGGGGDEDGDVCDKADEDYLAQMRAFSGAEDGLDDAGDDAFNGIMPNGMRAMFRMNEYGDMESQDDDDDDYSSPLDDVNEIQCFATEYQAAHARAPAAHQALLAQHPGLEGRIQGLFGVAQRVAAEAAAEATAQAGVDARRAAR